MYIIHSSEGFWSNELGWVEDYKQATQFTEEEKNTFPLPMGFKVEWIELEKLERQLEKNVTFVERYGRIHTQGPFRTTAKGINLQNIPKKKE